MTILHLISTFPPLTETFILREIRQLRKRGLNVIIGQLRPLNRTPAAKDFEDLRPFVSSAGWFSVDMLMGFLFFALRKPRQVWECFRTVFRSFNQPKHFPKMLYVLLSVMRLAYRFRNDKIELVRADFLHTGALAARFMKSLLGVPYSITAYTVLVYYKRCVLEEILKEAAFVVADTRQVEEFLLSTGASPDRVHLIRNGVSVQEFLMRSKHDAPAQPIVLGVGSLFPKKGFHVLLSACALLRQRAVRFRCVIIGGGEERQRLINQRRDLELDSSVEMLGYVSLAELRDWYYRASVFVAPSIVSAGGETDGLPTVLIEALASGLPVVAADTAGIPEVIQDGVTGFLVPTNAPEPLADRIQMLLERPDLREKFACAGRRLVEHEFDLDRKVEAVGDLILESVISKSARDLSELRAEAAQ